MKKIIGRSYVFLVYVVLGAGCGGDLSTQPFEGTEPSPGELAVVRGALDSAAPSGCRNPYANEVVIFEYPYFTGRCAILDGASTAFRNISSIPSPGFPDKALSSLKVGSSVRAILYENVNGNLSRRGYMSDYEGPWDYPVLGTDDNRTSSIYVDSLGGAQAAAVYLGNYPWNAVNFWAGEAQGVAHDATSWYLSQNEPYPRVIKVPLSYDLNTTNAPPNPPIATIPPELQPVWTTDPSTNITYESVGGYYHVGDPDVWGGYLFVPLSDPGNLVVGAVAVYQTSDMSFKSYDIAYRETPADGGIGWLSVSPGTTAKPPVLPGWGRLYTSQQKVTSNAPVEVYAVNYDAIAAGPGTWFLYDEPLLALSDRDGLSSDLEHMQGGDLSDDGTLLYLSNGYGGDHSADDWGLRAYNTTTGGLEAVSANGYGAFNFQSVDGTQEPEGVDFGQVSGAPYIGASSSLHVVVLENGISDSVYMKHYSFPRHQEPQIAAKSWASGRVDAIGLGSGRDTVHTACTGSACDGTAWSGVESLGGISTTPPTMVSWGSNRLDLFVQGTDGHYYHKSWDGTQWRPSYAGWNAVGTGTFMGPPAAVSWGPNRIDLFGQGLDQAYWHSSCASSSACDSPTGWSGWEPRGGAFRGPPTVVSDAPNHLFILGQGLSRGSYFQQNWLGSSWSAWYDLGGLFLGPPTAISWGTGRVDVFGQGTDRAFAHLYWAGAGTPWLGWFNLGREMISPPRAVSWGANRIDLVGQGLDGTYWHNACAGIACNGVSWNGWESLGPDQFASGPTISSWGANRLDVFGRANNGTIRHKAWTGTAWVPALSASWYSLGGSIH